MITSYYPSRPFSKYPESPFVKIGEKTHQYSTGTMYEHLYSDNPYQDIFKDELYLNSWVNLQNDYLLKFELEGQHYYGKIMFPKDHNNRDFRLISKRPTEQDLAGHVITLPLEEIKKRIALQYGLSID